MKKLNTDARQQRLKNAGSYIQQSVYEIETILSTENNVPLQDACNHLKAVHQSITHTLSSMNGPRMGDGPFNSPGQPYPTPPYPGFFPSNNNPPAMQRWQDPGRQGAAAQHWNDNQLALTVHQHGEALERVFEFIRKHESMLEEMKQQLLQLLSSEGADTTSTVQ